MSEARIGIRSDSKQAEQSIKSVQGLFHDLAATAKKNILTGFGLGSGVAAWNALGSAVRSVGDYVGDAIQDASSLAESQSKVNVVFGEAADSVNEWAEDSAQAFGQSKQQALEAVGTYGNLFQAFGLGRTEAASMSKSLVELAADLASFNNTSVDDALIALRAGLSGETEPLKRFGIALNDARMRAELASQGVTNLGATLTAGQKATAAYALIMKDSALAQGDFERTSDGLANQQRILTAELENVSAEVGEKLLPVMVELAHFLNESVVPALHTVVEAADTVGPALGVIGDVLTQSFAPATVAIQHLKDEAEHLEEVSASSGAATARNWTAMGQAIQDAIEPVPDEIQDAHDESVRIAGLIPRDVAKAIMDGQQAVESGVELLTQLMNDEWTDASREAYYAGILTSQQLAEGLASGDADVRSQAILVRDNAIRELERLQSGAYDAGANAGNRYSGGIRDTAGAVQGAANTLRNTAMSGISLDATLFGQNVGWTYGGGLASTTSYVFSVAQQLRNTVRHALEFAGSPAYTESREIGEMVGKTWGEGLQGALSGLRMPELGGLLQPAAAGSGGFAGGAMAPVVIENHLYLDGEEITAHVERRQYYGASTTGTYPRG